MSSSSTANDLARLQRSAYWREDEGRLAVKAWRASGQPLATFARHHGLGATRLRWWRNRLLAHEAPATPASQAAIVPVALVRSSSPAERAESTMEIVLASGHVVRVQADFDADALIRLVRTLEAAC